MIRPNSLGSSTCHSIFTYQNGEYLGEAYFNGVCFRMNKRRPEYMSKLALRSSGVALLAGALLFVVSATKARAGCNPPGQTRTEIEDFTVKDTVSGNVATATAAASPNPGTLAICDDGPGTATIEMSATTSMGDRGMHLTHDGTTGCGFVTAV